MNLLPLIAAVLMADLDGIIPVPLIVEKDGPVVQMLVPGFSVRELPVKLSALNNLEYAPDGRLFAAGYDGKCHLLQDSDGDGLEDKVSTFWNAPSDDYSLGMVVKDGMPHVLLSTEIVRFRDQDGDGVPDQRETVVKGWEDPQLATNALILHRRVDSAMGLAVGPGDSWYLTMGSANPANGYWQIQTEKSWDPAAKKAGSAVYSTNVLRGCLLRIGPDGKVSRLNSGLRYIMSLQWNEHGDLFGTDQEGATWLANGNPFDELLHLQEGRHYGFPPRHPTLLPNVVDEPSVWDYGPQHQSVCGFRFNGPRLGAGRFGPSHWAQDAILTGAARGKLWRTKLVRNAAGYVAQTELIASLGMIAVDCAISPRGDLVLACHAGPPDWGSGPRAMGRVFKISYQADLPQPIALWARNETETVVEFDQPLRAVPREIVVECGRQVYAADRLERFRPGYAVVKMQQAEPRFRLPVRDAKLNENGRELTIRTSVRTQAWNYAVTLSQPGNSPIDLAGGLSGVAVSWRGANRSTSGWLPHLDLAANKGLATEGRKEILNAMTNTGRLTMRCQLDLANMLRPAIQPGSKLDYEPPPEIVTVVMDSDAPFALAVGSRESTGSQTHHELTVTNKSHSYLPLRMEVQTPVTRFDVSFHTREDSRPRALGLRRILLPFASPPPAMVRGPEAPEIVGGNWENGRQLFLGKAACATCHQIRGQGFAVGPDLSNLIHRDYASVFRDIKDPNATINPDAIAYTVTTRDGQEVTGVRASETESELHILAAGGVKTGLKKSEITKREANKLSMMPTGVLESLTSQEVKDLMTFLLTEGKR